jgi:hypothetical protein
MIPEIEKSDASGLHKLPPRIAALMRGVIDPHIHSGPSTAARLLDHLELLRQASRVGYTAVVTKDHDYSGVATAALIRDNWKECTSQIYSGIVLNNAVGGLNPYAVEHSAAMGGKIVWLPTLAAANHLKWEAAAAFVHPGVGKAARRPTPVLALQDDGAVRDDMKEILDIVARTNMTLAGGHLHVSEIWAVFEEAKRRGIERMIVNHPEMIIDASLEDVRGLAEFGALIEHSLSLFIESSRFRVCSADDLKAQINIAGVDRTVLCTDLGQTGTIGPIEGMAEGIQMCLDAGYTDADIRKMTSTNVARLLNITPEDDRDS